MVRRHFLLNYICDNRVQHVVYTLRLSSNKLDTLSRYRTIAQREGIDKIEVCPLLYHTVQGIDGVYIHEKALSDRLLIAQEKMTTAILALLER